MNMHGIAVGYIHSINPQVPATLKKSSGYTVSADGTQIPTYTTTTGMLEVQGLTEREFAVLTQTSDFNMNAVNRKVYAYGSLNMVLRTFGTGGDLIQLGTAPNITTWKLVRVFETWPDWCAVVVRQQLDTP